ncbi:MAG: adenylate kinase [Clostridia bacterium]
MNLLIVGAPGAGKGTQAAEIAKRYKIPHISTGNMFRAAIKAGTELGMKAKEIIDMGGLVPDDITSGIVRERLLQKDCENGFLLDGYPRTITQANDLAKLLKELGKKIDHVISIEIPDDDVITRITGRRVCLNCGATYHLVHNKPKQKGICDVCGKEIVQRVDDVEETVRERLKIYEDVTLPIIGYYEDRHLVFHVDGEGKIEEVFERIKISLESD